jgi:hypothetical protein
MLQRSAADKKNPRTDKLFGYGLLEPFKLRVCHYIFPFYLNPHVCTLWGFDEEIGEIPDPVEVIPFDLILPLQAQGIEEHSPASF